MNVGLFVPCYVDQFYPSAAIATLQLLERYGCTVHVPTGQTCCGQPLANSGMESETAGAAAHFFRQFEAFDHVVAPSASCVYHMREHAGTVLQTAAMAQLRERTHEICEFLVDELGVSTVDASFPHRVGLHASCHGLRGLRLAQGSECVAPAFDKVRLLLESVKGIDLMTLDRTDACCGFGGTFAVAEPAVSVAMGRERLDDHLQQGTEFITGTDMSCLMHLEGLIRRSGDKLRVIHVSQILNGGPQ